MTADSAAAVTLAETPPAGAGTVVRAHQLAISASVSGSIPASFAVSSALRP